MTQCSKARYSTGFAIFNTCIYAKLGIKNAAKEKFEIVKVQDFCSEFLAKPPQAAKCVRTTLRIDHQ